MSVNNKSEVKLKFWVPSAVRTRLVAEMTRAAATLERSTLSAMYLDTADGRLARKGIVWRLRREGRRWIQTLKCGGANTPARLDHEVIRPNGSHDALAHAGTPLGKRLIALLHRAHADGIEPGVRFHTSLRRITRRARTGGAVVVLSFDEGRLLAAGSTQRIREIEFELVAGPSAALLALAERWRKRFALIHDPRSKAERGERLAQGSPFPALRKAMGPKYSIQATADEAFCAVIDECLAQISHNAIGLADGDPGLRAEHVHQLRVGIRRLRSALRSFQGWTTPPAAELVEGLRALFAVLGMSRDSEVLGSGVMVQLAEAGAPRLTVPAGPTGPDPVEAIKSAETQRMLLAWIAWRAALMQPPRVGADAVVGAQSQSRATVVSGGAPDAGRSDVQDPPSSEGEPGEAAAKPATHDTAAAFHRNAERRLRRWHGRIVAYSKAFDDLDEDALHALRKRIKRQRYAVEFFAPVLARRKVERYAKALAVVQERMGEFNDLVVARTQYQERAASDPAAWFALGWLAARIAEVRALTSPELGKLAKIEPPTH